MDDNDFHRAMLRDIIKETFKLSCDAVCNGEEAVIKYRASLQCCPYKLIFTEVHMPVLGGIEATNQIAEMIIALSERTATSTSKQQRARAEQARNTRIVALANSFNQTDREECLMAGMSFYLNKPADYKRLKDIIDLFKVK